MRRAKDLLLVLCCALDHVFFGVRRGRAPGGDDDFEASFDVPIHQVLPLPGLRFCLASVDGRYRLGERGRHHAGAAI